MIKNNPNTKGENKMKKQVRFWWDMEDAHNIGWYSLVEHIEEGNIDVINNLKIHGDITEP